MLTILSAFDDRARPKGSRDPLGAEASWSYLGRKIIGNLTTITTNLDNFIVALICCHYANRSGDDITETQERYIRSEQVAAYLRLAEGSRGDGILGITRAARNFAGSRVLLGTSSQAQLLVSQTGYGLWGLYSSALEAAGLITGANRCLTAAGKNLVDAILEQLGSNAWDDYCRLSSAAQLDKELCGRLSTSFAAMLKNVKLRANVVNALLSTQRECALQAELFPLAQAYIAENPDGSIEKFCEWVLKKGQSSAEMQVMMRRINALDPLLKFADIVMLWLQGKNDEDADEIAGILAPYLNGIAFDDAWEQDKDQPHFGFLKALRQAALAGDATLVVQEILTQNKALMKARGGAAWIELDGMKKLVVRVRNDLGQDHLSVLASPGPEWRYTYFLHSFLTITQQGMA